MSTDDRTNTIDKESLHKEIDLIQSCINRMASNSFLIKGWAISIIAVVLALSEKNISPLFLAFIVLIPTFSFWYLDSFFLHAEKKYREMYSWVLEERLNARNANMYDLNPDRFKEIIDENGNLVTRRAVMFSETLRYFYGIPVLLTIAITVYSFVTAHKKEEVVTKVEIVNAIFPKTDTVHVTLDTISIKSQGFNSVETIKLPMINTAHQSKSR